MLRRSVSELASRGSFRRVPWRTTAQVPSYLSSRSFSAHHENDPDSGGKTQSNLAKIVAGSAVLGSALFAASYYGFLDGTLRKEASKNDNKNLQTSKEIHSGISGASASDGREGAAVQNEVPLKDPTIREEGQIFSAEDAPGDSAGRVLGEGHTDPDRNLSLDDATCNPEAVHDNSDRVVGEGFGEPESNLPLDDATSKPVEDGSSFESPEMKQSEDENKVVEMTPTFPSLNTNAAEFKAISAEESLPKESEEFIDGDVEKRPASLLDDYGLGGNSVEVNSTPYQKDKEDNRRSYINEDGKLVIDFLEALHAAEKIQAELDAKSFAEEKRVMKDKYEKELKDVRVRELMYAEREATLEKELNKEKLRAAAALKSLQENLEQKFITEIELKEKEVERKLAELRDVSTAELAAAIASEKASHLEKMTEANLHINALCMAFYARSEEVRHKHSAHKLALGALALEDALAKGLPLQKEIEGLRTNLADSDEDMLMAMVLSSLPEDLQTNGTKTLPQLYQKFEELKGTLRHFSLIPPGGGGVLAHTLASVASWIKVKEADFSGDGIESVINKVDTLLAQAKLCEAAESLEIGVEGTQAAEVVGEWVREARSRAIAEQALEVLQAYATSISFT